MSITDSAPSSAPLGKPAKAPQRNPNRIRRGQKLDEILSLSELRLNEFASSSSESTFDPSSSSTPSAGSSPFQLQEYLSLLVRRDPHAVETITSLPSETDISIDDSPFQNVDTDIWVYEQLRRLVLDLTTPWLTALQTDCSKHLKPTTCAAMNAGDWMYLCASHGEEKQCCAIDYMVHTLDGATSLLNSARHFPSRTYVPNTSLRHFGSIARRLSRIFVHAWCYHREVFDACEAETSLYARFLVLVETYDLTATDNLPPRPGSEPAPTITSSGTSEFDRGTPFPFNGATKRERSGTAAMRSSLAHALGQSPFQLGPQVAKKDEVDARDLVPPPAPSPRATAVLSRPEHEEGADGPEWSTLAAKEKGVASHDDDDDDDDDDEEDEEEDEDGGDDRTQKISREDDDATINLRGATNGLESEEKEIIEAVAEAAETGEAPEKSTEST